MFKHLSTPTVLLIAGLIALPACDKKKDNTGDSGPPGFGPQMMPKNMPGMPGMPGGGPPGPLPLFTTSDKSTRQISENNLKMIGLGMHNHHDKIGYFPAGIYDKSGKVGLSWRVQLLPFIEQESLFKQFKLDEPWDSPDNKKLIERMPKLFAAPLQSPHGGYTFYRSFSGEGALIPLQGQGGPPGQPGQMVRGKSILEITDGTSNTLMVSEGPEPVIWTKPDELPFAPGKPPKLGGGVFGDGVNVVLCDGSTRFIPITVDPKTLSNLIQINDGQIVKLP